MAPMSRSSQVWARDDANAADLKVTTSLTIDPATNGANGLDTGSLAADTWYYVFVIQGTSGVAGLMSTSTTPTLPSGYDDAKRRVGMVRTNSSAALYKQSTLPSNGNQRRVHWNEDTTVLSFEVVYRANISTQPTWDTADLSGVVAPTSKAAICHFYFLTASTSSTVWYRRDSSEERHTMVSTDTGFGSVHAILPVSSTQTLDLQAATGDEDLTLQVQGYLDDLTPAIS